MPPFPKSVLNPNPGGDGFTSDQHASTGAKIDSVQRNGTPASTIATITRLHSFRGNGVVQRTRMARPCVLTQQCRAYRGMLFVPAGGRHSACHELMIFGIALQPACHGSKALPNLENTTLFQWL
jgi:hypothetical protein